MRIKNEYAPLLFFPLFSFLIFWFSENKKKNNDIICKKVNVVFLNGDSIFIDKNKLDKEIKELNNKKIVKTDNLFHNIENINGIKKCLITIDIDNVLLLQIVPINVFAKYEDSEGKIFYVDDNFNFLEYKPEYNEKINKNIFLITNETTIWKNKKKDLKLIYKMFKDPQKCFFYKFKITKQNELVGYNFDNEAKKFL